MKKAHRINLQKTHPDFKIVGETEEGLAILRSDIEEITVDPEPPHARFSHKSLVEKKTRGRAKPSG